MTDLLTRPLGNPRATIAEPGIYDIPGHEYHADPVIGGSLTSGGARKLLPPSCPALFRAWLDGQRDMQRDALDFGKAAHRMVLGVGDDLDVVDAIDWRTKDAKAAREDAYRAGRTPILRADYLTVLAMADALNAHPMAARLLSPERGKPEQTVVWRDPDTGVMCRSMLDHLPDPNASRPLLADYKTAASAHPDAIQRAVYNYGYHVQLRWYSEAYASAWDIDPDSVASLLVVQEKTAPYLVTVAQIDPEALRVGAARAARAREVYAQCAAEDRWPGYADDVTLISLPRWAREDD